MNDDKIKWVESIEALLGDADSPPPDTHKVDEVIEKVTKRDDGWDILTVSHTGFFLSRREIEFKTECAVDPKPGDALRLYSRLGSEVIGVDINGQRVYLRSERECNLSWLGFRASNHRKKRERFAIERPELDRRYEELPPPLKSRIDRFRSEDPAFRADSESYEMAVVGDAPKIARALAEQEGWTINENLFVDQPEERVEAVVKAFYERPYDEQRAVVPDLLDGHSGNTFGCAVGLAQALLTGKEV